MCFERLRFLYTSCFVGSYQYEGMELALADISFLALETGSVHSSVSSALCSLLTQSKGQNVSRDSLYCVTLLWYCSFVWQNLELLLEMLSTLLTDTMVNRTGLHRSGQDVVSYVLWKPLTCKNSCSCLKETEDTLSSSKVSETQGSDNNCFVIEQRRLPPWVTHVN